MRIFGSEYYLTSKEKSIQPVQHFIRRVTAQMDFIFLLAERDSVAWQLDNEKWEELQKKEPDVAQELLRISLKLTSERMSSITS